MDTTEFSFPRRWPLFATAFFLFFLAGCGSSPRQPNSQVTVTLNQTAVTLLAGTQEQFTAVVQGTSNTAVTWSVNSIGGGNSSVGTITGSGLYTAPLQLGTFTVAATSMADTSKSASAAVTVNIIAITPATAGIGLGATQQFSVTVSGQSNPAVTWSVDGVAGGNASVGTISGQGLYTAPSQIGNHTIAASVSTPAASANAAVTVFDISVSPAGTTLAPGSTQQFSSSVQGLTNTGVTWSVDGNAGGNSSVGTISSTGLYTAPFAIGGHTIAAASLAYPSTSATAALTVINVSPGAVLTYHNDDARDGAFTQETTLAPSVVNSTQFGKLLSYPVDGQIYAQPLFIPQLAISGASHNVVFVATENNSVYAFDAGGSPSTPLWSVNLGAPLPKNDSEGISPEIGITSTPVIDITANIMYVLTDTASGAFELHALNITSGAEELGGPVQVTGSVQGTGADSDDGTITLESACYQRAGLALNPVTNTLYIAFAHCNHGWVLAYNKTSLQQTGIFNVTPDGAGGGVWNSGGAPAVDDQTGNVFVMSGVDLDDPPSGYNDSFLKFSPTNLSLEDFFQPDNAAILALNDADLASGSPVVMPNNPSSTPYELIGGGKDGQVFVVNRNDMGAFSSTTDNVIETIQTGVQQYDNIFATPVYWNGFLYYHCSGDVLRAFSWSNGQLSTQPVSLGQIVVNEYGATLSLSANGTNNGILWEIDNSNFSTGEPSILRAYDPNNLGSELYDSTQAGSRDTAGPALKFTIPTIASGKVFVGTSTELDIYGLLSQ
jgi:hypothetical protein